MMSAMAEGMRGVAVICADICAKRLEEMKMQMLADFQEASREERLAREEAIMEAANEARREEAERLARESVQGEVERLSRAEGAEATEAEAEAAQRAGADRL